MSLEEATADNSTRCEACKFCGAFLELDGCGHRFHSRCIYSWPATHCEACDEPIAVVHVFRKVKNLQKSTVRKGKWSIDEYKYANMMMKQFQLGVLPLADGLHLRVFMANMLQCDPLRISKKYSGEAIGKQNFLYRPQKCYSYNHHVKLQKQLSNLRNHYYWHIQYRCNFGLGINIQKLMLTESDYWIREFCKFAKRIGQNFKLLSTATASPPSTDVTVADDDASSQLVVPPSASSLLNRSSVKHENSQKNEKYITEPPTKDEICLKLDLYVSSSLELSSPHNINNDWSDLSSYLNVTLSEPQTTVGALPRACSQESLKKDNWMNDWMKETDLEWIKGVALWSFSLSEEPLADFT